MGPKTGPALGPLAEVLGNKTRQLHSREAGGVLGLSSTNVDLDQGVLHIRSTRTHPRYTHGGRRSSPVGREDQFHPMAHFCRVAQAIGQWSAWTGRSVELAALACSGAQGELLLRTQRRVAPPEDVASSCGEFVSSRVCIARC